MKTEKQGWLSFSLALMGFILPAILVAVCFYGPVDFSIPFVVLGTPLEAFAYSTGNKASETIGGILGRWISIGILMFIGVFCIPTFLFCLFMTLRLS